MEELKRCPFCGAKVAVFTRVYSFNGETPYKIPDQNRWGDLVDIHALFQFGMIVCEKTYGGCGCSSGIYENEKKAIAAWNRRATQNIGEEECCVQGEEQ